MSNLDFHPDDIIAALATPPGASALAVIRTSGSGSIEAVASLASRPDSVRRVAGHSVVVGELIDPDEGLVIDQVVFTVYRGPASYTGEDSVEISAHGSMAGVSRILRLLYSHGFREARRGEFTLRGFLNGKLDLTRAEAVREVIEARTEEAHRMAMLRLSGDLTARFDRIKHELLDLLGPVEIALDYPEEESGEALETDPFNVAAAGAIIASVDSLLAGFTIGRLYQEGITVVIAGATNAGKSSLFNLLLSEERAIVSDTHGTTRDYLESWVSIRGIPVRLIDTAGIRMLAAEHDGVSDHSIEAAGIARSRRLIEEADVVLYLQAADAPGPPATMSGKTVRLMSKADLLEGPAPEGFLRTSTITGEGVAGVEEAIVSAAGGACTSDSLYLESDHQKRCLTRVRDGVVRARYAAAEGLPLDAIAADLHDALVALGELTGEITREELLDTMFSRFCVGK